MEPPVTVGGNLAAIRDRIRAACSRSNRDEHSVQLVAVSKLQSAGLIREAFAAGQRHFAENYAQELRDKAEVLGDLPGLRWHAIGPLQKNKAKYVAKLAHEFHALDRLEIAQELSRRRTGFPLRCYLEINIAGEASKTGVPPDQAASLYSEVKYLPGLTVVGLMSLPPPLLPEKARDHFRRIRQLAHSLGLSELSIGTTADFEVAIEEGATAVRVGTAIFGERPG